MFCKCYYNILILTAAINISTLSFDEDMYKRDKLYALDVVFLNFMTSFLVVYKWTRHIRVVYITKENEGVERRLIRALKFALRR